MRPAIQPESRRIFGWLRATFFSLLVLSITWPGVSISRAASSSSAALPPPELAADPLVREALAAEARFDSTAALDAFLQADRTHPNNAFILRKISRQYSDLTIDTPDEAEKKRLCTESLAYSLRAVELQPDNAFNVLSLGIAYGKLGMVSDIRTRIENSRLVLRYAEQALQLNPDYDYAHHVLGRWHYEVASLGAGTRFLVKLIYGGLPPASTSEGVRHLRRAVELSPNSPSHHVELGFALLADGQREAAHESLAHALTLPVQEKHDAQALERARAALAKLN